ncbi:hypothetical protein ACQX0N_07745 [Clostridium tepidum]
MVDNVEFKNKNSEEFIKILNIIVNLLLYQATFYMIFAILANILVYIGINKEFAKPYSKLVGEVLSYIFLLKIIKKIININ